MGTIVERMQSLGRVRYRVIVKVLCQECYTNKRDEKTNVFNCNSCKFMRYNNVTDLLKFQIFLEQNHSNWDWWKVYKYIKGSDDNNVLATFKNYHKVYVKNTHGNWIYTGRMERNVPCKKLI